jgi:hypothetical protein
LQELCTQLLPLLLLLLQLLQREAINVCSVLFSNSLSLLGLRHSTASLPPLLQFAASFTAPHTELLLPLLLLPKRLLLLLLLPLM